MCHPVGHGFWRFRSLNRVLIFICLILKYGEGFRLIKNKQESEISRSNVLPRKLTMLSSRSFVVILVTTFPAFQPQGACEARVLINRSSMAGTAKTGDWILEILTGNTRQIQSMTWNPDSKFRLGRRENVLILPCSKSWLEIGLEILTRDPPWR